MKLLLLNVISSLIFSVTHAHGNSTQQVQVTLSCFALNSNEQVPYRLGSNGAPEKNCDQEVSRTDIEEIKQLLLEMQRKFTDRIEMINSGSCATPSGTAPTTTTPPTSTTTETQTTKASSPIIRNCDDVFISGGRDDGVYTIYTGRKFVDVYCELQTEDKWLVFQRRINGEVDFFMNWEPYVGGFGNKSAEYWLGLQPLHEITSSRSYKLRIDMQDWDDQIAYVEYSSFSIGGAADNFRLNVSGFSGNGGDSLEVHNGHQFTTKDRDNDILPNGNCAVDFTGAWWYTNCQHSNLNGRYRNFGPGDISGVRWSDWRNSYSLKEVSMKISPNN